MKTLIKYAILSCIGLLSTGFFMLNAQDIYELKDLERTESTEQRWSADQLDIKTIVDRFLAAAGNYDFKAIEAMVSENANIGITRLREGAWSTETLMVTEFLESLKSGGSQAYFEPVRDYTILISDGHLAIVKAEAILYRHGIPLYRNFDNFTLIKEGDDWKFLNLSYSSTLIPKSEKKLDLKAFSEGYTRAWCSGNPHYVAQFYAEDGSLTVNDADPARGRKAIAEVARSFMTDFPDLVLTCDELKTTEEQIEFHWTFTGTYTGVAGIPKEVKFSGVEQWQMDEDGLIKISKGQFDADEYARQLNYGMD